MSFSLNFTEVWAIDFEFSQTDGSLPKPICLVGQEISSGKILRFFGDELSLLKESPFPSNALIVAYYASAELGCYLELGWDFPEHLVDLYAEFRNLTNGKFKFCGDGLLGALSYFSLDYLSILDKEEMRNLALRGGPWTESEKLDLLTYCEADVKAVVRLYPQIIGKTHIEHALLRGAYVKAVSKIERKGIPTDTILFEILRDQWDLIKSDLIKDLQEKYQIFEGPVFKHDLWQKWISERNIQWERLPSGKLKLDEETFSQMAKLYPEIEPVRQIRIINSKLRTIEVSIGSDRRNRTILSIFRSKTGRNQPSTSKHIFGPSVWLRNLIKPEKGRALAYIDWSQQEFGIAAALSRDANMMLAYSSGDPYLEFAKQSGAVPSNANKETHGEIRELYKQCVLAVQYGMGAEALAKKIGINIFHARLLLNAHRNTYQDFWTWSDAALDFAHLNGYLETVFGWRIYTEKPLTSPSIRNFPMQANGAEMLRLAAIFALEQDIEICAPVHDAFLIESPVEDIEEKSRDMQRQMEKASRIILDGFELRTDVKIFRYPERYSDPRGEAIWDRVKKILNKYLEPEVQLSLGLISFATLPELHRPPGLFINMFIRSLL